MSTATIQEVGRNFRAWISAAAQGDTVAIVEDGREVARLVPPAEKAHKDNTAKPALFAKDWAAHMAELEEIFPEPIVGASEELEAFRADRF